MKSWLNFRNKHNVVPVDHSVLTAMESQCYVLSIVKAAGVPTPPLKARGDTEIAHSLNCSLFHAGMKQFFGNTWVGPDTIAMHSSGGIDDVLHQQLVYFHSQITDPLAVGVVELVVQEKSKETGAILSQYGSGWTIIRLFGRSELSDTRDVDIGDVRLFKHN